jgi:hypothetical protein
MAGSICKPLSVDVIEDGDGDPSEGGVPIAVVVVIVVVVVVLLTTGAVIAVILYRRRARSKKEKTEGLADRKGSEMEIIGSSLPSSKNPKKRLGLVCLDGSVLKMLIIFLFIFRERECFEQ